ncbi:hypothetical protein B0T22DRAFT_189013 [Podospora appendiculata]|uniref:FHA domain-containing protein n=1 Tax=Podospora appendiculata TaxID=314037 RepID=A0AAE1CE69_9PEZI|nr:hypothetical protein B0T22DRAFT_189013 [Podospora appendiculata]
MWLLESDVFEGRKLWLRPGKLYLFGRTASEPGLLAISDKTISRKHLTIQVAKVPEGGGRNLHSRSQVTIEDLNAKKGTLLNGVQIRGEKKKLSEAVNEVKLGMCPKLFRIVWHPVVLSFSFTSKELRSDPWVKLRECLEQLDIKYSAEYDPLTSHVVTKKRNTPKGLQALINGKYIVTDSFITALVEAASTADGVEDGTQSALERDFEGSWPNALDYLPPRGEEPVNSSPDAYAPDERRKEVFDGYTFVFYEKKQYETLFSAITHGKGKALLKEVTPRVTEIDDFIRYVKGVAGEKGLGSFDDGSEGKGVVVVRYLPAKGNEFEWFAQFLTAFAQRLDHRPIDQREFLEAILVCDASILRRPLEVESQAESAPSRTQQVIDNTDSLMEVDQSQNDQEATREPEQQQQPEPKPRPRQARGRRAVTLSRFKGFDLDDDEDEEPPAVEPTPTVETRVVTAASQDSLFVSQRQGSYADSIELDDAPAPAPESRQSRRKRALSPLPEHDNSAFMNAIAPTAAAAKRRRIEAGQPPIEPTPEPEAAANKDENMIPESPPKTQKPTAAKSARGKKVKEPDAILELARQHREEAEALAAAERQALAALPTDEIDYAAIRRLHIIEECEVHFPDPQAKHVNGRDRDRDVAEGRWDPQWNGRKNFKRFRKQGEPGGRPAPRIIIRLEEVKPKEYGIGDDYWLENDTGRKKETQSQAAGQSKDRGNEGGSMAPPPPPPPQPLRRTVIALDSSDEEDEEEDSMKVDDGPGASKSGSGRRTQSSTSQSQALSVSQGRSTRTTQSQAAGSSSSTRASGKRTAAAPAPAQRAAKKPKMVLEVNDSDDSDDELKFRFGKRG